jgi:hypothetical protein
VSLGFCYLNKFTVEQNIEHVTLDVLMAATRNNMDFWIITRAVWRKSSVSEEHISSIFRVKE